MLLTLLMLLSVGVCAQQKNVLSVPNAKVSIGQAQLPVHIENTDEIIDSYLESTDIRIILNRVANGEVELLNKTAGSYGDFTKAPRTLAEALQLQMDSNRLFQSLPVDTRRQFDDDPNKFFAAAGSTEWFEKLADILPEQMRSMNNTPPAPAEKAAESNTTE